MENEEFVRLEQLVDTLIDNYNRLKDNYRVLEGKLRDSEEECELLKMELTELQEQRSEVSRRVSGLLGRIEQWESEQGNSGHTESEQNAEENEEFSDSAAAVTY
ncbi:MAG: cell division protein ZapB [Candidatus Electrothrix sp. AUS4]|nr:cell division protein ZapB [Candidatus Electrothrix sp. AUS4]